MAVTYQQCRALPGKRYMCAAALRKAAGVLSSAVSKLRLDKIMDDKQEREAEQ